MNKTMRLSAVALGAASLLFLSACGDDDPDPVVTTTATATATETVTPSPTPSPTGEAAADQLVHLVCPAPVGKVDALTDSDDEWGAAYVKDSDVVLWPVAFGKIVGTASDGGKFTDPAHKKPGADQTGSIKCAFTGAFTEPDDTGGKVTVNLVGTVYVLVK